MRIAVTGKHGQVVTALIERAPHNIEIVPLGRPDMDLADTSSIAGALARVRPDVIVSAAAYTAVDKAESEAELAYAVNATGPGAVAAAARAIGAQLIHLSTDYVFDGSKPAPYTESDAVAPLGVYGASKLAGEQAVLAQDPTAVICRTAWVYSPFGANFVKTMLRLAGGRDELGVVADQMGNPTSALDIADAVLGIARKMVADPAAPRGVFHMTGTGGTNWADFAEAIFAASAAHDGPHAQVRRITTADYPTPARRPANSRFDCSRLEQDYGIRLPEWRNSLEPVVARLIHDMKESIL